LEGGTDNVSGIFAYKDCKYFDYGLMPLHSLLILQYGRPKIADNLLIVELIGSTDITMPRTMM